MKWAISITAQPGKARSFDAKIMMLDLLPLNSPNVPKMQVKVPII